MRFLLPLPKSGKRFPGPTINDLDDVTNAPYHTCELGVLSVLQSL
jgi:hypothetical protein